MPSEAIIPSAIVIRFLTGSRFALGFGRGLGFIYHPQAYFCQGNNRAPISLIRRSLKHEILLVAATNRVVGDSSSAFSDHPTTDEAVRLRRYPSLAQSLRRSLRFLRFLRFLRTFIFASAFFGPKTYSPNPQFPQKPQETHSTKHGKLPCRSAAETLSEAEGSAVEGRNPHPPLVILSEAKDLNRRQRPRLRFLAAKAGKGSE